MSDYTYSVMRSHRDTDGTWEKVEASGLNHDAARAKEAELRKAEIALYPHKTSWVRDIFYLLLENGDEINKELQRQRMERCNAMQRP